MKFKLIKEGIRKTEDGFIMDFDTDIPEDIINLTTVKLYNSHIFDNVYHFGYKFNDECPSSTRTEFINWLKGLDESKPSENELNRLISKPISQLIHENGIENYSAIIYPKSNRSNLVPSIFNCLDAMLAHGIKRIKYEVIKNIPSNITFDWDEFGTDYDINSHQYAQMKDYVENTLLPKIHNLDYFSIGRDVKNKYRKYIQNFLIAPDELNDALKCLTSDKNILIIDDINTSGSTLNELIRIVRTINTDSKIFIFTLIGKDV